MMADLILFELINPSDCVTFYAPDAVTAECVAGILGSGAYGYHNQDKSITGGLTMFKTKKLDAVLADAGFAQPDDALLRRVTADAFASCAYVGFEGRKAYDDALAQATDKVAFKIQHDEERRSSLNKICPNAWVTAERIVALINEYGKEGAQ